MSLVHPFKLNLFKFDTGEIINDSVTEDNLKNCIPLLTMSFANRKLTIGDVFEFDDYYFVFSAYKGHIQYNLSIIMTFNFLLIKKDGDILADKIDYFSKNEFEHAYLKDIDKNIFENKFKFLFNYFYDKESMFKDNKTIRNYLIKNNNIGINLKESEFILFEINKNPVNKVKQLLKDDFTFSLITDFILFDMLKKFKVKLGDIYSLKGINQEKMQTIDYFLRKNKMTKQQFENTKKYYSSVIHILDGNCEVQQISLAFLDIENEEREITNLTCIKNLFWLDSFEQINFNLNDNKYLEKYLLLLT